MWGNISGLPFPKLFSLLLNPGNWILGFYLPKFPSIFETHLSVGKEPEQRASASSIGSSTLLSFSCLLSSNGAIGEASTSTRKAQWEGDDTFTLPGHLKTGQLNSVLRKNVEKFTIHSFTNHHTYYVPSPRKTAMNKTNTQLPHRVYVLFQHAAFTVYQMRF